ncbi:LysM domain-containing protein [Dioscorea alata]|uniref:LysM domain-containing protein n=1 Tax=Dioscorea alata TaxID=55571 RepID=A0ACB7WPI7_DIOAL|nr:LysM domain-containing protein [Dioscorea alata]
MSSPFLSIHLLLHLLLFTSTALSSFICNSTTTATCSSLIGYVPDNETSLSALQSLFQTTLLSLVGANSLPLSTPSSHVVAANKPILISIPCNCSNGNGTSAHVPTYTVKPNDNLDAIAINKFGRFVTNQQIAAANGIPNPNLITPGQVLWIPLPCSCDPVDGDERVHLAHKVAPGSSLDQIAADFGVNKSTVMRLNNISDPATLQASQILDVPLRACSSSISSKSLDSGLRLSNGSYAVTANGCVLCKCTSSFRLRCNLQPNGNTSVCPAAEKCGNLEFGKSSSSGCENTTCDYAGYTNSTGLSILTTNYTDSSTCSSGGGSPTSSPSNHAHAVGMNLSRALIFIHIFLGILALWQ